MIRRQLDGAHGVPLIGFGGAPFTLASYAIEGGHSQNFALTKSLMYSNPRAWHRLCEMLSSIIGEYMKAQIEAGVQAIQIFDSWAGALELGRLPRVRASPHAQDFRRDPRHGRADDSLRHGHVNILHDLRDAGGDVIGADWRIPLDEAWDRIGHDRAIQGNLDPDTASRAARSHA